MRGSGSRWLLVCIGVALACGCGGSVRSSAEGKAHGASGANAGTGGFAASVGGSSTGVSASGGASLSSSAGGTSGGLLGASCSANSDCYAALVCAFDKCRAQCNSTRDCVAGVRCAHDGTDACLLPEEMRCAWSTDCPAPLVCGPDGQCRNSCSTNHDCVAGEVCFMGLVCAEVTEFTRDGGLVGVSPPPDGGNPGSGSSTCVFPPLPADHTIDRPGSPPYAECYGCQPTLFTPSGVQRRNPVEPCKAIPDVGKPNELPCGACSRPGAECTMAISAFCDCDGAGPRPAFLDPNYFDDWLCECLNGQWSCWMDGISGASCSSCSSQDAGSFR